MHNLICAGISSPYVPVHIYVMHVNVHVHVPICSQ